MYRIGALAALTAAALLAGCSSGSSPSPSTPPTPATSNQSSQAPTIRKIPIAGPVGLAAAGSTVWAVAVYDGAVIGFDARTGRKLRRVEVGDTPLRAVFDGNLLWVTVFGAGKVVAVDPQSGQIKHRVDVPGQPEGIVAAFGAVWVVRQAARKLTRVSPTGTVGRSYPLGSEPRLVAASAADLFVADVTDGTITRIDPRSGRRTVSKQVCDGAQNLVDQDGTLWVTCTRSDTVVAVDERTLRATRTLTVKGEPDGVRVVAGHVFVLTTTGPKLYELPTRTQQQVVPRVVLGRAGPLLDQANDDFVVVDGQLWATDNQDNRLVTTALQTGE